jgi:hypothetical protein
MATLKLVATPIFPTRVIPPVPVGPPLPTGGPSRSRHGPGVR